MNEMSVYKMTKRQLQIEFGQGLDKIQMIEKWHLRRGDLKRGESLIEKYRYGELMRQYNFVQLAQFLRSLGLDTRGINSKYELIRLLYKNAYDLADQINNTEYVIRHLDMDPQYMTREEISFIAVTCKRFSRAFLLANHACLHHIYENIRGEKMPPGLSSFEEKLEVAQTLTDESLMGDKFDCLDNFDFLTSLSDADLAELAESLQLEPFENDRLSLLRSIVLKTSVISQEPKTRTELQKYILVVSNGDPTGMSVDDMKRFLQPNEARDKMISILNAVEEQDQALAEEIRETVGPISEIVNLDAATLTEAAQAVSPGAIALDTLRLEPASILNSEPPLSVATQALTEVDTDEVEPDSMYAQIVRFFFDNVRTIKSKILAKFGATPQQIAEQIIARRWPLDQLGQTITVDEIRSVASRLSMRFQTGTSKTAIFNAVISRIKVILSFPPVPEEVVQEIVARYFTREMKETVEAYAQGSRNLFVIMNAFSAGELREMLGIKRRTDLKEQLVADAVRFFVTRYQADNVADEYVEVRDQGTMPFEEEEAASAPPPPQPELSPALEEIRQALVARQEILTDDEEEATEFEGESVTLNTPQPLAIRPPSPAASVAGSLVQYRPPSPAASVAGSLVQYRPPSPAASGPVSLLGDRSMSAASRAGSLVPVSPSGSLVQFRATSPIVSEDESEAELTEDEEPITLGAIIDQVRQEAIAEQARFPIKRRPDVVANFEREFSVNRRGKIDLKSGRQMVLPQFRDETLGQIEQDAAQYVVPESTEAMLVLPTATVTDAPQVLVDRRLPKYQRPSRPSPYSKPVPKIYPELPMRSPTPPTQPAFLPAPPTQPALPPTQPALPPTPSPSRVNFDESDSEDSMDFENVPVEIVSDAKRFFFAARNRGKYTLATLQYDKMTDDELATTPSPNELEREYLSIWPVEPAFGAQNFDPREGDKVLNMMSGMSVADLKAFAESLGVVGAISRQDYESKIMQALMPELTARNNILTRNFDSLNALELRLVADELHWNSFQPVDEIRRKLLNALNGRRLQILVPETRDSVVVRRFKFFLEQGKYTMASAFFDDMSRDELAALPTRNDMEADYLQKWAREPAFEDTIVQPNELEIYLTGLDLLPITDLVELSNRLGIVTRSKDQVIKEVAQLLMPEFDARERILQRNFANVSPFQIRCIADELHWNSFEPIGKIRAKLELVAKPSMRPQLPPARPKSPVVVQPVRPKSPVVVQPPARPKSPVAVQPVRPKSPVAVMPPARPKSSVAVQPARPKSPVAVPPSTNKFVYGRPSGGPPTYFAYDKTPKSPASPAFKYGKPSPKGPPTFDQVPKSPAFKYGTPTPKGPPTFDTAPKPASIVYGKPAATTPSQSIVYGKPAATPQPQSIVYGKPAATPQPQPAATSQSIVYGKPGATPQPQSIVYGKPAAKLNFGSAKPVQSVDQIPIAAAVAQDDINWDEAFGPYIVA